MAVLSCALPQKGYMEILGITTASVTLESMKRQVEEGSGKVQPPLSTDENLAVVEDRSSETLWWRGAVAGILGACDGGG